MNTSKQYEKYLSLEIPNRFKLRDIYDIFEKEYKAVEISISSVEHANENAHFDFENIKKCYLISNVDILDLLNTELEKMELTPEEKKCLVVFLGSHSGEFLDYWHINGYASKLAANLGVFVGLCPEDILSFNNTKFVRYLSNLEDAGYIAIDYEKLYRKYRTLDIPHRFKLQDIYDIFENEYKAVEISKYHNELTGGITDENADFDIKSIRKCYHITDKEILDIFYSKAEKFSNLELESREDIVVFLGSYSGEFLDYCNLMGGSSQMDAMLSILIGINPEDISLDNPKFLRYLSELETAGFLD